METFSTCRELTSKGRHPRELSPANVGARLIAFYLPQFHPIPENNLWWGNGFTEWTNVAKAKPLFRGHYQPHIPADLGFYDLRVQETRQSQAMMAGQYGIEGFCYWHYWFGDGIRLLQRPFDEVLASGVPQFPFCLGWANESWTGIWHGAPKRVLMQQTYPGREDHRRHFEFLLKAFADPRYLRVDGKCLLYIYRPTEIPECADVMNFWRDLASKAGLAGLYLVGQMPGRDRDPRDYGLDAGTISNHDRIRCLKSGSLLRRVWGRLNRSPVAGDVLRKLVRRPLHVYRYADAMNYFLEREIPWEYWPTVVPNWDNTPRSGSNGVVLHDSTPELFRSHLRAAIQMTAGKPRDRRIVFVKSWNEWAEGNHLEPDARFGLRYLEVVREELLASSAEEKAL